MFDFCQQGGFYFACQNISLVLKVKVAIWKYILTIGLGKTYSYIKLKTNQGLNSNAGPSKASNRNLLNFWGATDTRWHAIWCQIQANFLSCLVCCIYMYIHCTSGERRSLNCNVPTHKPSCPPLSMSGWVPPSLPPLLLLLPPFRTEHTTMPQQLYRMPR